MRVRLAGVMALMLLVGACTPDTTPTGVQSSTAPSGPTIQSLTATPSGTGIVTLTVVATDPTGGQLTDQWSASQGTLSATTGPSVLWRVPSQAGTYTATVQVTDGQGVSRTATQQFQVSASGQAVAQGQTQIGSVVVPGASSVSTGTGQFQVASPVPFASASIDAIAANPNAPGDSSPTPPPSFVQPVDTPVPGPTPATPAPQPIATPTNTPPPATSAPSPLPTTPQPTPQPLTSQQPPSAWVQVPPSNTATGVLLEGVSFPGQNDTSGPFSSGWACGSNTIIHSTDGGLHWAAESGIPAGVSLHAIAFGDTTTGYAIGSPGKIYRTLDGGTTWTDISPTIQNFSWEIPRSIAVYNDASVVVCTESGMVLRNDNANAANATGASTAWTSINTTAAPPTKLMSLSLVASSATFNTAYFAGGDGVFQMDSTQNAATPWKRLLTIPANENATCVSVTPSSDVWVGTDAGHVFHSSNGGGSWTEITTFTDAMGNGSRTTLNPAAITDIDFIDANNGWLCESYKVFNTADGGKTWTELDLTSSIDKFQINREVVNGAAKFLGWGVGPSGVVYQYVPTF